MVIDEMLWLFQCVYVTEMVEDERDSVVFAVNGERFEVSNIDPSTTLLELLRYHTRFKYVKLGCGEGKFKFL